MKNRNEYYSNDYICENPTWHIEHSPWKANHILNIINNNNLHPKTICEIGCGAGEILHQLFLNMDNSIQFTGYEISTAAYELCKERKTDRVNFFLGNLLEDNAARFDIVMAIDVVEHIEDCYNFMRELKKKGEYKIFHIPLDMYVFSVYKPASLLYCRKKVGHIHYFVKETVLELFFDTGYEIIDYFITDTYELLNPSEQQTLKSRIFNLLRNISAKYSIEYAARVFGGYSIMILAR